MAETFDPTVYPALVTLGEQIRALAGESSYRAGRDYLRRSKISNTTVSDREAHAEVQGSSTYRVSIAFDGAAAKVTCTCPAHRRAKHCKHVVTVSLALVEQPRLFRIVPRTDMPVAAPTPRKRRDPSAKLKAEALKEQQRQAGLALVDRLLVELSSSGLGGLGPEQVALLGSVVETVHGLKLRRLGNALSGLRRLVVEGSEEERTPTAFASLLAQISLTRRVLGAALNGATSLDPALMQDLIGKTWTAKELELVSGIALVPLASSAEVDGDFIVDSTYLIERETKEIFVERQITPRGLRNAPLPSRRMMTLVDEAGIYPGLAPRRIKLTTTRRSALSMRDVQHIVEAAPTEIATLRHGLIERLAVPVDTAEVAVMFRPDAIVASGDHLAGLDRRGELLPLVWPAAWSAPTVHRTTADPSRVALFGLMELSPSGPVLRCLSLFGDLGWLNGPIYPELRT